MRVIFLAAVVLCCGTFAYAQSSSEEATLIPLDLQSLENTYLETIANIEPVYNNTYDDIYRKLYEFALMNYGIEDILTRSSLLSQYITPYAITKQQADRQVGELHKIMKKTNPAGANVYLTSHQIKTFDKAFTKLSNSDVIAIRGIISLINSAETLVNNPKFKFSSKHIIAPNSLEAQTTDGLSDFIDGNQGIVDALQSIVNLNQATVIAQQKNPLSSYFVESLFTYYASGLLNYQRIVKDLKSIVPGMASSESTKKYEAEIRTVVNQMINHSTTIAGLYQNLNFVCVAFHHKILHPDPQQMVISAENANGGIPA